MTQYVTYAEVSFEYEDPNTAGHYWKTSCYERRLKEFPDGETYTQAEAMAWWMNHRCSREDAVERWTAIPAIPTDGRTRQRTDHKRKRSLPISEPRRIPENEKHRLREVILRILP